MRVLFDTHLLIWALTDSPRLSAEASALIRDPDIEPHFSIASVWETAIKFGLGRRDFVIHPKIMRRNLLNDGYTELALEPDHVFTLLELPKLHRDPFDRILVAQARAEGISLMTSDNSVAAYGASIRLV